MLTLDDITLTPEQESLMVAMIEDVNTAPSTLKQLVRYQKWTKKIHTAGADRDTIDWEIASERERQEGKWGQQNHDPFKYLAILGEEVGESNNAAIEAHNWKDGTWNAEKLKHYRTELIQVAAVAKAMVECLDRGTWA